MDENKRFGSDLPDGMDEFNDEDTLGTIVMTDEEGNDIEFCVIDEVKHDGANYLLLVESGFVDDDEADALIFKEVESEGENAVYEEIEDDDEFNKIADIFSKRSDEYDLDV